MALGDSYASLPELKSRLGITTSGEDTVLTRALSAASRGIEKYCRRQFNDAGAASARVYSPITPLILLVDDFSTTTGLLVDADRDNDGTFEEAWASTDVQAEPLNGIYDGVPGWPYWKLVAVGDFDYAASGRGRATARVTAQWGWAAVPDPVKECTLIVGEELWKLKDAPFGVAGFGDFGAVRVRDNPKVVGMLQAYRRDAIRVA